MNTLVWAITATPALGVIDGIPLSLWEIGGWGIAVGQALIFVRMIYKGKLHPDSTLNIYREALRISQESEAQLRAIVADYQQVGHSAVKVIESIQTQERSGRDEAS